MIGFEILNSGSRRSGNPPLQVLDGHGDLDRRVGFTRLVQSGWLFSM